eukprot:CAMPEP_0118804594 /NCGR_PEP_ID=MMETSP1161-20130426/23414_1 /TAXON_ID=249345 /ORGANISM="Picochlorum oklahomensis, Strain CCMP2329" /LENGTH=288 /DNA_ID=CAMNT_0006733371 /DNA_START=1 /DNA_END=867 /DNA_ORIENTATION=+
MVPGLHVTTTSSSSVWHTSGKKKSNHAHDRDAYRAHCHSNEMKSEDSGKEASYEFTYQGNDGREKATFEQAFKSGIHGGVQDYIDKAPWDFGYQMSEKNLVWHDDLKERLYSRVVSEEMDLTEEELEGYLHRLRALLPDASEKLIHMPVKILGRLIQSIDTIPERLMRLKMIFPKANASLLAIRNPELVLGFDPDHLETIANELNDMFPNLEVDKIVEENPSMLDIEELKVAMAEAQRIMPQMDVQKAMGSDPQLILSFQRGTQLIPYDPVSPEERQRDEDEYNQYYN